MTRRPNERPPHTAIVGLQWGDEGKGKIVDLLTAEHDVIVRYNGGANAGHTVVVGSERYALHLIPSGILYPDKECVVGNGVVVDPEKLLQEIDALRARGVRVGDNLRISDRAHVVMPYHKEQDAALEEYLGAKTASARGNLSIGTTRRGIGPAYADKIRRSTAIRVGDLLDPDYLRSRLHVICTLRTAELEALGVRTAPLDPDALATQYAAFGERLRPHVVDSVYALHDAMLAGRSLLFEGANASLLDIDHGTFPYVTSSNCSTLGIPSGTGVPGHVIGRVLGIMKAYSTRVGAGPFPTELDNELGSGSASAAASTAPPPAARAAAVGSTWWPSATAPWCAAPPASRARCSTCWPGSTRCASAPRTGCPTARSPTGSSPMRTGSRASSPCTRRCRAGTRTSAMRRTATRFRRPRARTWRASKRSSASRSRW